MSSVATDGRPEMIIVTGHLIVPADARDAYLASCREVVERARRTPGCLDFAVSADLLDPGRVTVVERWVGSDELAAFRGSGVGDEQAAMISSASVVEFEVDTERPLS